MQVFGEWGPDQSGFNGDTIDVARNVVPRIKSYAPVLGPQAVADTAELTGPCKGLWFVQSSSGVYYTFAATADALFKYDADLQTFTDVSRLAGGAYGLPDGDRWSATIFGNRLIVCQLGDDPQYIDVDSGTNFDDLPNAPTAKFVAVMDDKVVFAHLLSDTRGIQWSDVNDSEEYSAGLAGNQTFVDHGTVQGFFPHARVVMLERGIRSIISTGDIYSFQFAELSNEKGTTSPWSCVEYGARLFYLSVDGFHYVSGNMGEPVNLSDERITVYFFETINRDRLYQVEGTFDPFNPYLIWSAPTGDTEYNDRFFIFNTALPTNYGPFGRFSEAEINAYALARLATAGVSLEGGSDSIDMDEPGLPSLDSPIYLAGAPILAIVGTDNILATLNGERLEATIETNLLQFNEVGWARLREARFLVKGAAASSATVSVKSMNDLDEVDTATYGSAVSRQGGRYPFNDEGMFHKLKFIVPEETQWTHAMGFDVDAVPTSAR